MTFSLTKIDSNIIQGSDFLTKPETDLKDKPISLTQFVKDFTQYTPYLLLALLFLKSISKDQNNLSTCYIIFFGLFLNNVIKTLNQESPIAILIFSLQLIPQDKMNFFTILLFYISALFQIMRLTGTRFYIKLRKIRIWGGPIYGCLIFWRILYGFGKVYVYLTALFIFLIGVKFRPEYSEEEGIEEYKRHRRIHKYCMILNFSMILVNDIWSHCNDFIHI